MPQSLHRTALRLLLLFSLTSSAFAQSLSGVWQGTPPVDRDARVVVRLDSPAAGRLRGTFQYVDRDAAAIPFSAVTAQAGALTAESDLLHVSFQGRLAENGQSLIGTWTEGRKNLPLTLIRTAAEQAWRHGGSTIPAMAATVDPAFEVASVRPSAPSAKGLRYDIRTPDFAAHDATLADLLKFAFQLRSRQISGAPAWTDEEKFDIYGKPDAPGQPSVDQYRTMVRKLLEDRFGLRFHMEQRSFPVYALTSTGPHTGMVKSNPDLNTYGIALKPDSGGDTTQVRFSSESMTELSDILMNFIEERQIVNESGLGGRFDFTMTLPTAALQVADSEERFAAFLHALQPLGFGLTPKPAAIPVMVLEKVGRPSDN